MGDKRMGIALGDSTLGNVIPNNPVSIPNLSNIPEGNPHIAMKNIFHGDKGLSR